MASDSTQDRRSRLRRRIAALGYAASVATVAAVTAPSNVAIATPSGTDHEPKSASPALVLHLTAHDLVLAQHVSHTSHSSHSSHSSSSY